MCNILSIYNLFKKNLHKNLFACFWDHCIAISAPKNCKRHYLSSIYCMLKEIEESAISHGNSRIKLECCTPRKASFSLISALKVVLSLFSVFNKFFFVCLAYSLLLSMIVQLLRRSTRHRERSWKHYFSVNSCCKRLKGEKKLRGSFCNSKSRKRLRQIKCRFKLMCHLKCYK